MLYQRVIAREGGARQAPMRRPVEREYPIVLVGLEAHGVPIRRTLRLQWRRSEGVGKRSPPGTPVEIMQHRSAPVALPRRGNGCGEVHAERHFIRQHELIDVAG